MNQNLTTYLSQALIRLQKLADEKAANPSPNHSQELLEIRMLEDLIKEQVPDENAHSSARKTR